MSAILTGTQPPAPDGSQPVPSAAGTAPYAPYPCNEEMILFHGQPSQQFSVNLITGSASPLPPLSRSDSVNAIGFNVFDYYIYGYDQTENTLVRVGDSGEMTLLSPRPVGMPAAPYSVGALDLNGYYYLYVPGTSRFYTVDLRPNSSTFLKLVDPVNLYQEQTSNYGTPLTEPLTIGDWAFNPTDGLLYGVERDGTLCRIDERSGTVMQLNTVGPNPGDTFGSVVIDGNGRLYAVSNSDGTIYRYMINGDTAAGTRFSSTDIDAFNDAALCPYATIELDYGDAPDVGGGSGTGNYHTLLASNGPRHGTGKSLYLGYQVTSEEDAYQNATATGDDLMHGIQDDGIIVPLPMLPINASGYQLSVTAANYTGEAAYLYGWVDFNKNGLFEADEAAPVITVPAHSGTGQYLLDFSIPGGTILRPDHTFVRLRLTTDSLTDTGLETQDTRSIGPATDGEVEDYILKIGTTADLSIMKTADPAILSTGDTINYTVTIVNNGPETALNVILEDLIPPEITNPMYTLDGSPYDYWPGTLNLGEILSGQTMTVIIQGVFDGSVLGPVVNTATVTSHSEDSDPVNNSSTVTTPVNRAANLVIDKVTDTDPAVIGELLTFAITVTNNGPDDAENVIITDIPESDFLLPEYSPDNGVSWYPWHGQSEIGILPSGTAYTLLLRGTVGAQPQASLTNTATVTSSTEDPLPEDNTVTVTVPKTSLADLSIDKTGEPNPVFIGQKLTYTIIVTNAGPSPAEGTVIADTLPSALTDTEYSLDSLLWYPWTGSYDVGIMEPGTAFLLYLRSVVSSDTAPGPLTNTATVSALTSDPDPDNNNAAETVDVEGSADISVTKSAVPSPAVSGEELLYTIDVTNHGPSEAVNVKLSDILPPALENAEFSTDGISFLPWSGEYTLPILMSGNTVTFTIRADVSASQTDSLFNTALVTSDTFDPDIDNNTATVTTPVLTSADIQIQKDGPDHISAGEKITYVLLASNLGPSTAYNVQITDTVPAAIIDTEFSLNGIPMGAWNGNYLLTELYPAETVTVEITGTLEPAAFGELMNTAAVTSSTPDPKPENNSSDKTTTITASADISVVKTSSPHPVLPGEQLTYTIIISNAGPSAAESVMLEDTLPDAVTDPEYSADGQIWSTWSSPYALGTILPEVPAVLYIRGVAASSAFGEIRNTVSVSSPTPDPNPDNNTYTDITLVNVAADLSVTKTADPLPALPGELLTYTVTVSNAGPADARNVILTDTVPGLLSDISYSADQGGNWMPWPGFADLMTVKAGESSVILIRGTLSSAATGTVRNIAIVSSPTPDPDPLNNSTELITPVQAYADLSVTKTAAPDPALIGQQLTYTITVHNAGPDAAENIILADNLPSIVTQTEYSTDSGNTWNPWVSPYTLGYLNANQDAIILIRGTLAASAAGLIHNDVSVSSSTPDPNPDNNTFTLLTPIGEAADISVIKTASPVPVIPGSLVTYTITIANAGPNTAEDVILTDFIPSELESPEASLNGGSFSPWAGSLAVGSLSNAQTAVITLKGNVLPDAVGQLHNVAEVSTATPDPNPDNNRTELETALSPSADLSITKTGMPTPAIPGESVTYTLTISNAGPSVAKDITVIDAIPALLENVQYQTNAGSGWMPWSGLIQIASINPDDSAVLTIRGTLSPTATGTLLNTAFVTSATPDPEPNNNRTEEELPVLPSADISILKSASPNPAVPGDFVIYTLTASNAGPSAADTVTVRDTMPAELANQEFSINGGNTWMPWSGSYTFTALNSGGSATVLLRGLLTGQSTQMLINSVTIESNTPDPHPENNSDTIITPISTQADLALYKTASPSPVSPGTLLTYHLTAVNLGPDTAENVTLTDTSVLHVLTQVQFSSDGGRTWNTWDGSYEAGSLLSDGIISDFQIRGVVPDNILSVTNNAVIHSTTLDPDSANNTAVVSVPVLSQADLSVTKTAVPSPAVPGQWLTYTLTVTNSGPGAAQDVFLIDTVPSLLSNVEFSADNGQSWKAWVSPYRIESLDAGKSAAILIRGVLSQTASGTLTNTAIAASSTPDPNPADNTATDKTIIQDTADLSIVKIAHPIPAVPGQYLIFSILISNRGPAEARNVMLTDMMADAEYSLDNGIHWQAWAGSIVFGSIPAGTVRRIQLRTLLPSDASGLFSNTAGVTASTPDPDPDNNTVTINTPISDTADLSLSKTADVTYAVTGDVITYQIAITNLGNTDAENVMLRDDIPDGLTSPEYSADGGTSWFPWNSPLGLGTIQNQETRTILIRGTVLAESGIIANTAYTISDTPDPDYTNNNGITHVSIGNKAGADLAVTKTVRCRHLCPGQFAQYRITVINLGPETAKDVMITDTVPCELINVRYSLNDGCSWHPWDGKLSVGDLPGAGTVTLLLNGRVGRCSCNNITNEVHVSSPTHDPNLKNNRASANISVCGS